MAGNGGATRCIHDRNHALRNVGSHIGFSPTSAQMPVNLSVQTFFDRVTGTITHVVFVEQGGPCAIVDPVLDFDAASGRTSTASADAVLAFVHGAGLRVEWILETHAHADHLTSADYLRSRTGARVGIGAKISVVQQTFHKIFGWNGTDPVDGSQFDALFADEEEFSVGRLGVRVLHVPGHTPASVAYQAGDCVFVGDLVFRPEMGSARCDFPGGDARELYRSVRRVLALPPPTRLFLCHDYPPEDEAPCVVTTVAEQRQRNIHFRDGIDEEQFVALRSARDANLPVPRLILPSLQVNIHAGRLPPAEANGVRYLKIPLNVL